MFIILTMKKFFIAIVFIVSGALSFAQSQFEISKDPENGNKVLKGILSKNDIVNDTAFGWFAENQKNYIPHAGAVEALKKNINTIQLVAFSGTWCSDSKYVIPKFFSLLDAAGFPQDRLTLIGTDRNKKTLSHLAEAFNIINVPTLIVMKDGKEIGRVVEYGKYGVFEKDLAEIINSMPAN